MTELRGGGLVADQRAAVAADQTRVAIGLTGDLLRERVGERLGVVAANDEPRLPELARNVDADLQRTPTAVVDDRLRGGDQARAVKRRHAGWIARGAR